MQDQAKLTLMLKEARYKLGRDTPLEGLLAPPLHLYLNAHDTGMQARIELRAPGHKTITVWEGSVWYSSRYEFNDRDKVLGLNPEADFAHAKVEAFFAEVERRLADKAAEAEKAKLVAQARDNCEHDAALAAYREMLG